MKPATPFAFVLFFFFSSCSYMYYTPNQPNLPMVKEKGVTKVNMSVGSGEASSSFDLNGFHSVADHVGVMLNYSYLNMESNYMNVIEAGAGYFHSLGQRFGYEVYGTGGYGSLVVFYDDLLSNDPLYVGSTSMARFAIQPDLFYSVKNFEAGAGVRLHYFNYGAIPGFDVYTTKEHLMAEPTLKLALGWNAFKITLQGTYTNKLNSGYLEYDTYMISMGMVLRFQAKTK
jgi:hypothetical protein